MSKLIRSFDDKVFTGVCGGLGRYFNIDSTLVRIGFALATLFGVGSPIIIYIVLALVMPNDDPISY